MIGDAIATIIGFLGAALLIGIVVLGVVVFFLSLLAAAVLLVGLIF